MRCLVVSFPGIRNVSGTSTVMSSVSGFLCAVRVPSRLVSDLLDMAISKVWLCPGNRVKSTSVSPLHAGSHVIGCSTVTLKRIDPTLNFEAITRVGIPTAVTTRMISIVLSCVVNLPLPEARGDECACSAYTSCNCEDNVDNVPQCQLLHLLTRKQFVTPSASMQSTDAPTFFALLMSVGLGNAVPPGCV